MPWSPPDSQTLHAILGRAPGFIVYFDADLKIRYINRASYGFDIEGAIGRDYASYQPPDQADKVLEAVTRARETREEQYVESFMDVPDGRVWFSSRISALFDEQGQVTGYVSIIADITEQKLAQAELEKHRTDLFEASHRAGMAEVATGLLHNIGNVVTSVNVASALFIKELDSSRLPLLDRALALLDQHRDDVARFLTDDEKGRQLPRLLAEIARELGAERARLRAEAERQREHIDLIRATIDAQQDIARKDKVVERVILAELIDRLVSMFRIDMELHQIGLDVDVPASAVTLDKPGVSQILANLIRNAVQALVANPRSRDDAPRMGIAATVDERGTEFLVRDNGAGIEPENLERIFQYGFTTKSDGHGFGLHASALAAESMGGTLDATSAGPDQGATFRLWIPHA